MRMWMVEPKIMCRQHLLGEHVELHMFVGSMKKGIKMEGYIKKGLAEFHNIKSRHDELVEEMRSRGYGHQTPIEEVFEKAGRVDRKKSLRELLNRCPRCMNRMKEGRGNK